MQTASGENFGAQGLIPHTHLQLGRVPENVPSTIANKMLNQFVLALHDMEAVQASELALEATITQMRTCFPTATKIEKAELEVKTLIKIRKQDVKTGKQPNKIPNKRLRT